MTAYAQENTFSHKPDLKELVGDGVAGACLVYASEQIAGGEIKAGLAIAGIGAVLIVVTNLEEINIDWGKFNLRAKFRNIARP